MMGERQSGGIEIGIERGRERATGRERGRGDRERVA